MSIKGLRLERWSGQLLAAPRHRSRAPCCIRQQQQYLASSTTRSISASHAVRYSAVPKQDEFVDEDAEDGLELPLEEEHQPKPPTSTAPTKLPTESTKLAALHARLGLPKKLPLQTLARTLIDPSADSNPDFNNAQLSQLGGSIISYHISEWLLVTYPRLPMSVLFAASYAYHGPQTLQLVGREWGVDCAAAPGPEVDPGFLQFERTTQTPMARRSIGLARGDKDYYRRGMSSRVVYDDDFGDTIPKKGESAKILSPEHAYSSFVKALVGSIYLHSGSKPAKAFVKQHILSRHLQINRLFQFKDPERELARLCAREGFEHPVARLLSETGRHSRTPVFLVGIFSGKDKLGEGSGASQPEARTRAAVQTLKAWYLYSPGKDVSLPSDMEGEGKEGEWEPVHIDIGEIIH
ncbi:ribonuclease III domain-containing protein [Amylocarpus encephaloides]|uniref:Large ribosomal subunit protein mL44 n=1 Tax=Amylocarpus encephaloides TaxID=45428 RepID=A0A9P8CBA0_9HELO|nr:ribonuclease III domain-containing protein [Amylocarpus encephaloides]